MRPGLMPAVRSRAATAYREELATEHRVFEYEPVGEQTAQPEPDDVGTPKTSPCPKSINERGMPSIRMLPCVK